MDMESRDNNIRILTPADGLWITNGEVFSKRVYLGINADPDGWTEATQEEYEAQMDIEKEE